MVLTASAASASRPFGITPQGARGESRKRLSPFLVQICRARSVLYSPSAMGVQRDWRDYTPGYALSAARVTCDYGATASYAARVGIDEHLREVLATLRCDTSLFLSVRGVRHLN